MSDNGSASKPQTAPDLQPAATFGFLTGPLVLHQCEAAGNLVPASAIMSRYLTLTPENINNISLADHNMTGIPYVCKLKAAAQGSIQTKLLQYMQSNIENASIMDLVVKENKGLQKLTQVLTTRVVDKERECEALVKENSDMKDSFKIERNSEQQQFFDKNLFESKLEANKDEYTQSLAHLEKEMASLINHNQRLLEDINNQEIAIDSKNKAYEELARQFEELKEKMLIERKRVVHLLRLAKSNNAPSGQAAQLETLPSFTKENGVINTKVEYQDLWDDDNDGCMDQDWIDVEGEGGDVVVKNDREVTLSKHCETQTSPNQPLKEHTTTVDNIKEEEYNVVLDNVGPTSWYFAVTPEVQTEQEVGNVGDALLPSTSISLEQTVDQSVYETVTVEYIDEVATPLDVPCPSLEPEAGNADLSSGIKKSDMHEIVIISSDSDDDDEYAPSSGSTSPTNLLQTKSSRRQHMSVNEALLHADLAISSDSECEDTLNLHNSSVSNAAKFIIDTDVVKSSGSPTTQEKSVILNKCLDSYAASLNFSNQKSSPAAIRSKVETKTSSMVSGTIRLSPAIKRKKAESPDSSNLPTPIKIKKTYTSVDLTSCPKESCAYFIYK